VLDEAKLSDLQTLFADDLQGSHNPLVNLNPPSAVIIPGPKVMTSKVMRKCIFQSRSQRSFMTTFLLPLSEDVFFHCTLAGNDVETKASAVAEDKTIIEIKEGPNGEIQMKGVKIGVTNVDIQVSGSSYTFTGILVKKKVEVFIYTYRLGKTHPTQRGVDEWGASRAQVWSIFLTSSFLNLKQSLRHPFAA
jgi:hypothetical protein